MNELTERLNKKYGVGTLMAHQWLAFNGDHHIVDEFLNLKSRFGITTAVETGTCLASTTIFLSTVFDRVITIEANMEYLNIAHKRLRDENCNNVKTEFGDSGEVLYPILVEERVDDKTIFFLDAHWNDRCPLKQELEAIHFAGIKPVIAIHDFKVPNDPKLGFDSYNGQDFEIDWIKEELDLIYGKDQWIYYYNSLEFSDGAKRGIIYIHG